MIQPTYKWKLEIDGYKKTTKFINYPSVEEIEDGLESLLEDVYYNNGVFDDDNGYLARINRNTKQWFQYSSYRLPADIENGIIYFVTDDYFQPDAEMSYQGRETLVREFYKKTAQAVKFSINEL